MNSDVALIRLAKPSDVTPMALVAERASAQRDGLPLPENVQSPDTQSYIEEKMGLSGSWTYVATLEDKVVGFVLGYPSSESGHEVDDPEAEYLSLLMVDPSSWGQRNASLLIDTAFVHSRNNGKHTIFLWTRESENERARAFYEHKGFKLTDAVRISEKRGPQVQYLIEI